MSNKAFPMAMTAPWIITFGFALHNWTLGICLGLCMGMAFGLFGSSNGDGDEKGDE